MMATEFGFGPEILQALLDHGAQVNQANKSGETALIFAAKHLAAPGVAFLVAHGADVNATDQLGQTALAYAGNRGGADLVKFLSEHGAEKTEVHIVSWPQPDPPLPASHAFALALGAMYAQYNGQNPHLLGYGENRPLVVRAELRKWWNVKDKASFQKAMTNLKNGGFGAEYRAFGGQLAQLSDAQFSAVAATLPADQAAQQRALREMNAKWGERSGLAWDGCRYANLVGDGYAAGYLSEDDAWSALLDMARDMQKSFSSWSEMADNFRDGRRIWSKGPDARFESCLSMLLDPQETASVWNQIPWQTDLSQ